MTYTRGRRVHATAREMRQLQRLIHRNMKRAIKLGATERLADNTGMVFTLSGDYFGFRIVVTEDAIVITVSAVGSCDYRVQIINGVASSPDIDHYLSGMNVPFLLNHIKECTVAPPPGQAYGFVANNELIGVCWLTPQVHFDWPGQSPRERDCESARGEIGLDMVSYFARDPRTSFDFVGQKDRTKWIKSFWRHYHKCNIYALVDDWPFTVSDDGSVSTLQFDRPHDKDRFLCAGDAYRRWSPLLNNFADYQPSSEVRH
ncbi:MAG: hypothetical protein JWN38_1139 [Candidatus Saccharibacteria bacterium]|nr:hypothetical protein [Candidatus Saccharibacteria bacterium]